MNLIATLPQPVRRMLRQARRTATELAARAHRRRLAGVELVAITGSSGKTTTKALIAAVLATKGPVAAGHLLTNEPHRVAASLLAVRPRHRFGVHELGGYQPGVLRRSVGILRPRIGVVTRVGFDHYKSFHGLDATAREKGTLVEMLPENGVAVLNADDEHVLAMRARTRARVVTYGVGEESDVRGEDVRFSWTDGLRLTVRWNGECVALRSRLIGTHWASAILAAVATGTALGVSPADAARAIETVEPTEGRLSVRDAGGVTFIEDTWKAPHYTIPASLDVLACAEHRRRIAVIGSISDYPGSGGGRYRQIARLALASADVVIFASPMAGSVLRVGVENARKRIHAVDNAHELRALLREILEPGDLVLLKGSNRADHLERIPLDRREGFVCWRIRCGRLIHCADCDLRDSPHEPVTA